MDTHEDSSTENGVKYDSRGSQKTLKKVHAPLKKNDSTNGSLPKANYNMQCTDSISLLFHQIGS